MYGRGATYKEAEVLGTSREQLVPLLYRHLLINLRRAGKQIDAGDIEGKAESLSRANDIVFELLTSLNREQGGELGQRLAALYAWFSDEIREAGRTLDRGRLDQLVELVGGLHEAWTEAARMVEARAEPQGV